MRTQRQIAPSRKRRQGGNTMVETALVFTVFAMLMFGTVEFGRAMFAYNQLAYLAEEGARYASTRGLTVPVAQQATSTSVSSIVTGLAVGIPVSQLTVTTTWQGTPGTVGQWVRVKVSYPFTFVAPYMPYNSLTMQSTAQNTVLR